jgi:murein L,D-transpeptidase YcbB/YkuD
MTEIGLLMTGVLSTTQPNLPHLPKERQFRTENGVHKSKDSQLSKLTSISQITPPEFMTADPKDKPGISGPVNHPDHIFKQIRQNHLSSKSFELADAQDIPTKEQLLARYPAYNRQPLPTLRFGSSGMSVRIMQRLLVSNGYGVRVDGIFGPLTEAAIKAFQSKRNLLVDGIVGQKTWWELSI